MDFNVVTCSSAAPPRVGFEDADYWNVDLWYKLSASNISCNPARCANPAICAIPNCTLVEFDLFYWPSKRYNKVDCDTKSKQMSTCVSKTYAWPVSVGLADSEDKACRAVLGRSDTGRNQILFGWYLHPAAQTIFCQANDYVSGYVTALPDLQSPAKKLTNGAWVIARQPFAMLEIGKCSYVGSGLTRL